ncbi:MAG: hypothetical protein ABJC33_11585 [Betaproteobacteria bacterium]
MTDDEALNTPHWGRPGKIVRTREPHAWRETWTYAGGLEGTRRLDFENGRLVAISIQPERPENQRFVSLSPR